jgi:hypothetical protein
LAVARDQIGRGWEQIVPGLVPLCASLVAHLGLLIALAVLVFSDALEGPSMELTAVASATSDDALTEFNVARSDNQAMEDPDTVPSAIQAMSESAQIDIPQLQLEDIATDQSQTDAATAAKEVVRATASYGEAAEGTGAGLGGLGASFFGVGAGGDRIIFIVDSSRSMIGKRWNHAVRELLRSIENLGPQQRFYVICFDMRARPVFDQPPKPSDYLQPNKPTIAKVRRWLYELENGYETRPAEALQIAMAMHPDAIYLLSDGELRDHSKQMLLMFNRDGIDGKVRTPIHTISLYSFEGKQTLQAIAAENGGNYSSID